MTATDLHPARVRWYRRRPPEGMVGFPRGVWWTGHSQLFIGLALLVLGPVTFVVGFFTAGLSLVPFTGLLMLAMAAPFAVSGLLLRAYASRVSRSRHALWLRIAELAGVVVGIAILAFAFVFVDVAILVMAEFTIAGDFYASTGI
jgi:hypothetical protein